MTYLDILQMIRNGTQPKAILVYDIKRKFKWSEEDGEYISDDKFQFHLNSYLSPSLTDYGMATHNVIEIEDEQNG